MGIPPSEDEADNQEADSLIQTNGGSFIAGNVNTSGGDVVQGDKNVYFGLFKIPKYLVFISILCITVVFLLLIYQITKSHSIDTTTINTNIGVKTVEAKIDRTPTPTSTPLPLKMPNDGFNIAVAPFTVIHKDGLFIREEETNTISSSVVRFLTEDIEFLQNMHATTGEAVTIWGPEQGIKAVSSSTVASRAIEINASVLVYGVLQEEASGVWSVKPKFYLPANQVSTTEEILGPNALGTPIDYIATNDASKGELNKQLNARFKALTNVIWGLSYYEQDKEKSFQKAAEIFTQTVEDPMWGGAQAELGQEILYLLLGGSYLQQVSFAEPDYHRQNLLLDKAEQAYETGLSINPRYVRLNNGLGRVIFQKASLASSRLPPCQWDWHELEKAQNLFTAALNAPLSEKESLSIIDFVAHNGLGQIFYVKGICHKNMEELEKALTEYKATITLFEKEPSLDRSEQGATIYKEFADVIFTINKNSVDPSPNYLQAVIDNYQRVIDLGSQPNAKSNQQSLAKDVIPNLFLALCYHGQAQNFTKIFDLFVSRFPNPTKLRNEMRTSINQTATQKTDLPEECQNGVIQ